MPGRMPMETWKYCGGELLDFDICYESRLNDKD